MRIALRHYLRLADGDLSNLWQNCLFAFDASVLLKIYECSPRVREAIFEFLSERRERLVLPYQFALEFMRNRPVVIAKQASNFAQAKRDFERTNKDYFESQRKQPYFSEESRKAFQFILAELENNRLETEKLLHDDHYASHIFSAFEGKVTTQPTADALTKLHDTARDRYSKKIPPGFADLGEKEVPDAYGDFIGWEQLVNVAKERNVGIILVTDDVKEDWWVLRRRGQPLLARPELFEEFSRKTQKNICIYTPEMFFRDLKQFGGIVVPDDVIEEMNRNLQDQAESDVSEASDEVSTLDRRKARLLPTENQSTESKRRPTADEKKGQIAQKKGN